MATTEHRAVATLQFGRAWIGLAGALAFHMTDESLTDFFSVYNSAVLAIRERFPVLKAADIYISWILGLSAAYALVRAGASSLSGLAVARTSGDAVSVLMIGNALGHIGSSVFMGRLMPGVYSSPVLLVAALFTLAVPDESGRTVEGVALWRHQLFPSGISAANGRSHNGNGP